MSSYYKMVSRRDCFASASISRLEHLMDLAVSAYETCLNEVAAEFGFAPTSDGRMVFERPTRDGSQRLWLASERRGAIYEVYPGLHLCFPGIRMVVKWLLRDSPFVTMESDAVVVAQPLDLTAPAESRECLRFSDALSALECCARVRSLLERWGIPFLDEYVTVSAWLKGYERRDARLLLSRQHHLLIRA